MSAASTTGWIEWMGGKCPVAPDTIVDVRFADGDAISGKRADFWMAPKGERSTGLNDNWKRHPEHDECDIVSYRIVEP